MNGKQFATHIGVAHGTVKRWLHEGMPCTRQRHGREVVVDVDAANAWIADRYPKSVSIGRVSHVYFAARGSDGAIKIGFSSDLVRRLPELRKECRDDVRLLAAIPGGKPRELKMHARFAEHRIDAHDEWFRPGADLLDFIESLGRSAA